MEIMKLAVKDVLAIFGASLKAREQRMATVDMVAGAYAISSVDLGREINRLRHTGLFPELE